MDLSMIMPEGGLEVASIADIPGGTGLEQVSLGFPAHTVGFEIPDLTGKPSVRVMRAEIDRVNPRALAT
jgi:hypothetical protein